jgi:hypothetical protein
MLLYCPCIIPGICQEAGAVILYSNVHINSGVYLASRRDFYTEKTEDSVKGGGYSLVLPVSIFDSLSTLWYSQILPGAL